MAARPERLEDTNALRAWVHQVRDESSRCVALIDPSRYQDPGACAHALGIELSVFALMPNLYAKYAKSIRELGPRLWTGESHDPGWDRVFTEALERQAASFLVVPRNERGLEEHLTGLIRMPQPDGGNLLFRFQDVVVLGALAPLLSGTQRRALLGPACHWLMVDVCRYPVCIDGPGTTAQGIPTLRLDPLQIDALGEALVPLTIIFQTNETDSSLLAGLDKCEQVGLIRERMRRARGHGLVRAEDIALYCILSLQLPDGFDRNGPVAEALQEARTRDIGFGETIDKVPVERWRAMDELMDAGALADDPTLKQDNELPR